MSEEIKVGLQVVVSSRYHGDSVEEVKRETKLYWIVGDQETKYRKSDLCTVGEVWGRNRISLVTPEKLQEVRRLNFADNLSKRLCHADFSKFSLEDLQVIRNVLDKQSQ